MNYLEIFLVAIQNTPKKKNTKNSKLLQLLCNKRHITNSTKNH